MFTDGPDDHELLRCINAVKKKLVAAGAKADNLPTKAEQIVEFVAGLRPNAMDVVREWFRRNSSPADRAQLTDALATIELGVSASEAASLGKEFWRAVLLEFVKADVAPGVKDFLGGKQPEAVVEAESSASPDTMPRLTTSEDADACLAIASGNQTAYAGRFLPTLVSGIISALSGDRAEADKVVTLFEGDADPVIKRFSNVVSSIGQRRIRPANPGFQMRERRNFTDLELDDPQAYPVFGHVKSVLATGQIFVKVTGLVIDGDLVLLSPEQARELFPIHGDVTGFFSVVGGGWKASREGIWRVEHRSSEKSAHYVIVEELARAYEVVQVPFNSNDPDAIRGWLTASYKGRDEVLPVFQTLDRLIFKLPGDASNPAKFNFDTPLDSYASHSAARTADGRVVSIDPFPASNQRFDCAPATTWIKRLLREGAAVGGFPVLTKAQVGALVDFVSSKADPSTTSSYRRAQASLEASFDTRAEIEEAIGLLLEIPRVKEAIEHEKKAAVEALRQDKEGLASEVEDLRSKKRELLGEIEKQRKSHQTELERLKKAAHSQELDLERRMKAVFERAGKDGAETLAQVSLIRALLSPGTPTAVQHLSQTAPPAPVIPVSVAIPETNPLSLTTASELKRAINRTAGATGLSDMLLSSVVSACIATSVVGLIGGRRGRVTTALADTLAGGVTCEVSITGDMFGIGDLMKAPAVVCALGSTSALSLGDFLDLRSATGCASVIELLGVNRAPPETLLPELLALGQAPKPGIGWIDRKGEMRCTHFVGPTVFLLSFVDGKSTFPLPATLASAIPLIQVDHGWLGEGIATHAPVRPSIVKTAGWCGLPEIGEALAGVPADSAAPEGGEARFAEAASCLGVERSDAIAHGLLAFRIGREDRSTIEARLPAGSADLDVYLKAFESIEIASLANQLFEPEIAA
ncbi:hypothetical protein [Alicycliphilus denitrificans]|uniref:hypothetical protein n=1 Tax=Alicycliphilus denitrificans TaxID=179636 RepID=UPI00384D8A72